jgi:hypothetical protein
MASLRVWSFFVVAALAMTFRAHANQIAYQNTTTQVGGYVFNGAASVSGDLAGRTFTGGHTKETVTARGAQTE